jgi:hypothetical protein
MRVHIPLPVSAHHPWLPHVINDSVTGRGSRFRVFIRGLCGTIPAFHDPSEFPTGRETTVGDAGSVGDAVATRMQCAVSSWRCRICKEGGSEHTCRQTDDTSSSAGGSELAVTTPPC